MSSNLMATLRNHLSIHRRRLSLTQEEVAFLIGTVGLNKAIKVCRDEKSAREPSLREALAYELLYGKPVRELFPGLCAEVEGKMTERAAYLRHRVVKKPRPKREETINRIINKTTV